MQGDAPPDDALAYAENAHAIATDPAAFFRDPSNHPFVMRVGVTGPLAAIYSVLGVSTWTTNLPCLIAAIVILLVVYAAAPTARAKCIGVAFAVSSKLVVLHVTELSADLLCGAATAVSILLLSRRDRRGSAGWVAGAVAVWFVAFLVKESTIWFAPAWLYAIAVDVRTIGWRDTARRFAPALGLGLALALLYVAVCAWIWGDPLARATGINAIADVHRWTPRGQSIGWWAQRLTYKPPVTFVMAFGPALVVAVVGARRITGAGRLWLVATASCLLMFWFGSASSDQYLPLPLDQWRMLLAVLPGVLVAAALAGDALRWRWYWIAVVVVLTVVPPARLISYRALPDRPETELVRLLGAEAAGPGPGVVAVCTTWRCLQTMRFYFEFQPPPDLRAVFVAEFAGAPPPTGERIRVVVDPVRARSVDTGGIPVIEPLEALGMPRLYWHRRIRLYDAGDGAELHAALRRLFTP